MLIALQVFGVVLGIWIFFRYLGFLRYIVWGVVQRKFTVQSIADSMGNGFAYLIWANLGVLGLSCVGFIFKLISSNSLLGGFFGGIVIFSTFSGILMLSYGATDLYYSVKKWFSSDNEQNLLNIIRGGKIDSSFVISDTKKGKAIINKVAGKPVLDDNLSVSELQDKYPIVVGSVVVPKENETLNILLAGSPGSGKTQALRHMTYQIRARHEGAMVMDPAGAMLEVFGEYFEGDVLLDPLDERSVSWSPFAELRGPADAARLARSIVPDGEGSSKEWNGYAQKIVGAVLGQMMLMPKPTNGLFLRALTQLSDKDLGAMLGTTPVAAMFQSGSEKMLSNIRSIIGTYLEPWAYLEPNAGRDAFSIRSFIEQDSDAWLFVPVQIDARELMRPLLGCWFDIASRAVLGMKERLDRRFWLLMDELPSLGRVSGLTVAAAEGRKFGLCMVAGIQSTAQLIEVYGQNNAQALLACFQNLLMLRTADADTADYLSRTIGEHEVERVKVSTSTGDSSQKGGFSGSRSHNVSTSTEVKQQRMVLPSEIQSLPTLQGFFKLAGPYNVARVNIEIAWWEPRYTAHVPKVFGGRGSARGTASAPGTASAASAEGAGVGAIKLDL